MSRQGGSGEAAGRGRGRPPSGARAAIIEATRALLIDRGLLHLTTKEVAREAQVSEASIYYHFDDKLELLVAVVDQTVPDIHLAVSWLGERVGRGTVRENLEELARGVVRFYAQIEPVVSAARADPELLVRFRSTLVEQRRGPHLGIEALVRYLSEEQRLGRVRDSANLVGAGNLLFGAAHFWAAQAAIFGHPPAPLEEFARDLVTALIAGLDPARNN